MYPDSVTEASSSHVSDHAMTPVPHLGDSPKILVSPSEKAPTSISPVYIELLYLLTLDEKTSSRQRILRHDSTRLTDVLGGCCMPGCQDIHRKREAPTTVKG